MDPWIAETKPKKHSWKTPKTTTIYHNFPKHSFPRVIYIYMYHLYHWFTTHFLIKWFKCDLMWKSSINARFSRKPRLYGNWKHVALTLRRQNQWVVCMELISGGNHRQKPSQYAKSHVCITGWWWLEPRNFMTFHIYIGTFIIPSDVNSIISQRGRSTTNQYNNRIESFMALAIRK